MTHRPPLAPALRRAALVAVLLGGPSAAAQPVLPASPGATWPDSLAAGVTRRSPAPERRVDRRRLLAVNVGLTALFTLARGVVGGAVRDVGGGAEAFGWGAAAGLGFYLAKDAVGRGDEALGVGLAFAAASLAENAGGGGGPFGHVRVGFGPLDLRLRTPLATTDGGPVLAAEADPLGALALLAVPVAGGRPIVRGGALLYVVDDLGQTRYYRRGGNTVGRVARVNRRADDRIVRHEIVHQIQAVQIGAVTPYGTLGALGAAPTSADGSVRYDVRVDWLYAAVGALNLVLADDPRDRPSELEAYELDEPPAPPPARQD